MVYYDRKNYRKGDFMKKSLFAMVIAFILIFSFACAHAKVPYTTGATESAPPNIAESDQLLLAMIKEVSEGHFEWKYKTVTSAEDIGAISQLIEAALENAAVKPPLAEGELAKSGTQIFKIRILNEGSVVGGITVYDDGITYGTEYSADTTELASTLAEIYEGIDCEEKDWQI